MKDNRTLMEVLQSIELRIERIEKTLGVVKKDSNEWHSSYNLYRTDNGNFQNQNSESQQEYFGLKK